MIRPSTRLTSLALAAALVAGTVVLASPASAATDTTAPKLVAGSSVSFSPANVDTTRGDGSSTVSVKLADDSSGVTDATLTLTAPGGSLTSDVPLDLTAGTTTNGTWTGLASFSSADYTGTWTPTSLDVTDAAGNAATITSGLGTAGVAVGRTADTVAPTLRDASTTVTSVDTTTGPVDAVVRVSAADDLSGVAGITVTFALAGDDTNTVEGTVSGPPVTGTSTDGAWDVPVTFPSRSAPGVWHLSEISLTDGQSNFSDHDETNDARLPSLKITVTTADDDTGPSLTSLTVGPAKRSTAYGRNGYVYAQVGFSDAVSGVESVQVTLQRPNGVNDDTENYPVTFDETDLKTGTSRNGTITVPLYVESFATGVWKVASVLLTDAAGNDTTITTAQLPGNRTTFDVSGTAADTQTPTSSQVAFSPGTLDTTAGEQQGTVLVTATDPDAVPAGIASGTVTLTGPSGAQSVTATFDGDTDLAAGDPSNGTFRAAFTLPANSADGAWTVTSLTLTDGARHTATISAFASGPVLTVLGKGRAPATVPGAPKIGSARITTTTATVTWTAPADNGGAPITGYVVSAFRSDGTPAGTVDAAGTSATMPNLPRGQTYTFTVAAKNTTGTGTASATSNAVTVPAVAPPAPTRIVATLSDTTATITWTGPTDNGGAAITGYVVTPWVGTTKQAATRVGYAPSATITDLPPGRTYTFRVAATNAAGDGAPSQASNSVSVAATVPAAPRVSATKVAGTSATVSWNAPADGGTPITAYRVVGSPAGSCTTAGTSCVVGGLTPDQAYSFTVLAINRVGSGAASTPSATVVAARPVAATLTLAATPGTVRAGTAITVAGRLVGAGAAAPGQRVRLQYRRAGSTDAWTTGPTTTTGSDGVARIAFRPSRSVQLRLVSLTGSAYLAATSAARTVMLSRVLTLGSTSTRVKRGKTVTLSGRATPVQPGARVTLQRRSGGRWTSVATKRVSGSTYAFRVRAGKRGSVVYRVITARDAAFAMSISNARTLRVR